MRVGRNVKVTALLAITLSFFLAHYLQPTLLYFPRVYEPDEFDESVKLVGRKDLDLLRLSYGRNMFSYLVYKRSAKDSGQPVSLFVLFGGNGMTALDWTEWIIDINPHMQNDINPAFLLVDYPGYGSNEGSPSPSSMNGCAAESLRKTLEVLNVSEINLLGHSIGAAVAARFAASFEGRIKRLVLSAPFTSIVDMVPVLFPIVPQVVARMVARHNWDNREALKAIKANNNVEHIVISHGENDEIVPWKMGKELADSIGCFFVSVPGTSHNDILMHVKLFTFILTSTPSSNKL